MDQSAGQNCRARLPGKTAGQDCRARLPGKTAGQDCQARLPGKTAGQDCRTSPVFSNLKTGNLPVKICFGEKSIIKTYVLLIFN
jgi:hypothetical protein